MVAIIGPGVHQFHAAGAIDKTYDTMGPPITHMASRSHRPTSRRTASGAMVTVTSTLTGHTHNTQVVCA